MSDKGSVFQKGGGGTNFEQSIQTAYLTTLIIQGSAPCIPANEIIEVAFQTTNRGYETDDLLIIAKSAIGQHRLLAQIKHNLTFSLNNDTFKEVIAAFWKDFNNDSIFDKTKDRLLIIKSGFTKDERNHLKSVLNWAKTHATETDFISEINRIKAKKDRLDIFRDSLKEANSNTALTDKELWEFLKCVDVLEYDFPNEGSIDETYFLNLIKLSKNKSSSANEKEIWDSILAYVSKLNKDGGSVTIKSIQKQELYKHFDTEKLNPYFKSVEKLRSDSEVILKPLKNTIGNFHLERKDTNESIVDSINNFQFTIITGKPGVGKSAAIKDVLVSDYSSASVFVFRADQFNSPHIANVFSSQGVNETIQDIFSCISLIPEKIIVIDSLEKLLEGDPENAFKQLLALLKEFPDIKIVATARKYSIDLIYQKFGIDQKDLGITEINPLNDKELSIISKEFPQLNDVLKNTEIKKLLESPKYLDFAISALNKSEDDFTSISLTEFKEKLWNSLVKDSTNRTKGFPAKREDAFLSIAVNRAREMKLFVKPVQADEEAIDLLENDEIIFQENQNRRYSPSHDILEDWALVKYVSSIYEDHSTAKELFDNLGNEPAIRRAFRLWVEDDLIDNSKRINELIKSSIGDSSIERYWADELLVAVFKSDNCSSFFQVFKKELLKNDATFLNRCIHLIRTACKESSLSTNNFSLLLPLGSGWLEVISFVKQHLNDLDIQRVSVCHLLYDWEYRLLFQPTVQEKEMLEVKEITVHLINQVESGDKFWEGEILQENAKQLISLLYNLSSVSKSEIQGLIERAFKSKENDNSWKLSSFYKSVIAKCLSGLNTHRLTQELPELVAAIAWREWKLKIPDAKSDQTDFSGILRGSRLRDDECWGIPDKHSHFPSGIYKTPFYNLLMAHPMVGLKFITEFLNYSVEFYAKADCEYKHEIAQIEFELNDGTIVKQWASWELWAAYRGSSVTHYAIESLLMSLEKYLLKTAGRKTETSRKNLQYMFNYLMRNSNNAAISSVLTSIAIACPEEVGEEMLPLLSVKEFYSWDLNRSLQESSTIAPQDNRISFAQEERWNSNQLPHRKKYTRGLGDFIVDYQFKIGTLNEQIHQLFDQLQAKVKSDDVIWKKLLTEIDIRNWEAKEYDEKLGGIVIQPKYEKEVSEFMSSNEDYFQAQSASLNYSGILRNAYEGKEPITLKTWKKCFVHYSKDENLDLLYDRPITLALIGLRDFIGDLKKKEKEWCMNTVGNSIDVILHDEFSRNYDLNRSFGLMEKEIALSSFHLLFSNTNKTDEKNNLISKIIYMLSAPFAEHEMDKIIEYVRTIFFNHHPVEAKRVWMGLIKYAQFKKSKPYFYTAPDQEGIKAAKAKEEKFIQELSFADELILNVDEINLDQFEGYLLARAFAITPYDSREQVFADFIKHFIPLLTEDLKLEEDYSYHRSKKNRQIQHNGTLDVELYISELILYADNPLSNQVVDLLYDSLKVQERRTRATKDLYDFVSKTLEFVVLKYYDYGISNADNSEYDEQTQKFWTLWKYLGKRIKESNKEVLLSTLFFNIRYLLHNVKGEANEKSWKALENDNGLYHEMILEFSSYNISKYVIDLFSTVGEVFLPNGLDQLVKILKKDPRQALSLMSPSAERLIKRLFYNHISTIKKNKNLINDFIWILNKMVESGSSEAYLFRENVITYKTSV